MCQYIMCKHSDTLQHYVKCGFKCILSLHNVIISFSFRGTMLVLLLASANILKKIHPVPQLLSLKLLETSQF